jgi:hypothetical protein
MIELKSIVMRVRYLTVMRERDALWNAAPEKAPPKSTLIKPAHRS